MPRRKFLAERQPLRHHAGLQLQPSHVTGAFSFLNPTHARFRPTANLAAQGLEQKQRGAVDDVYLQEAAEPQKKLNSSYPENVEFLWRSRDNRKGRHAIKVQYKDHPTDKVRYVMPQKTATVRAVLKGIWRMATFFPYWDISYLVAMAFTIGSSIWVINSFFVWFPLERPETEFPHEILVGGGVTALLGTTTFEIGSILMMLEAMNENATGCFGWALEQAFEEIEKEAGGVIMELKPRKDRCLHHHLKKSFFRKARRCLTNAPTKAPPDTDCRSFKWLPTLTELRTQYLREIGFIASLAQLIGATVFYTSGYTGLPGIYDHMSKGLIDGIYWTPQIVGGSLFITSGFLFTIETQKKWYIPKPGVLGWHVGFWNFLGGVGFTLCGAFGPGSHSNHGIKYQSSLSTFWGSWAFLTGSVIQWYECLEKYPVEEKKSPKEKNDAA